MPTSEEYEALVGECNWIEDMVGMENEDLVVFDINILTVHEI